MKEERYAHVKWFYGQSERAYYLNYFIMSNIKHCPQIRVASQSSDRLDGDYGASSLFGENLKLFTTAK